METVIAFALYAAFGRRNQVLRGDYALEISGTHRRRARALSF